MVPWISNVKNAANASITSVKVGKGKIMDYVQKFKKIPVEIEAIQLRANNIFQCTAFIDGIAPDIKSQYASEKFDDYKNIVIENGGIDFKTLESGGETQKANFGDYIIKGVKGEFYPCKPDIFKLTYESITPK